MPNRIIKESICTSDNIDQLSAFHETVFYRLMVNCDDYGRMDARPKILSSRLFPLKDIRAAQMEEALRALTSAELVILYEVDGKPFLQMKTWDRHQQVRAKKSKYPSPDEGICKQMISDDIKCPRNPIQSESESNPNPKARVRETDGLFEVFWKEYPNKVKKPNALKAWNALKPDEELAAKIMQGLARWKQSDQWTRDDGRFVPHPATWLHGRQWEDEVKPRTGSAPAQGYEQRDYSGAQDEARERMMRAMQEI